MRSLFLLAIITVLGHGMEAPSVMSETQRLSPAKRALANALSKISPIKVLIRGQEHFDTPSLCVAYDPAIQSLSSLLKEFKGQFNWVMMGDLSRLCIVPLEGPATLERTFKDANRVEAARLEMADLAMFIEAKMNLRSSESQTINIERIDEKQQNSGKLAFDLVADPKRYVRERQPTSRTDRTVQSAMSDEQLQRLYDFVQAARGAQNLGPEEFPLLLRVSQIGYGNLIVSPEEVPVLKAETLRLIDEPGLKELAVTVLHLCDLAETAGLGIVSFGN